MGGEAKLKELGIPTDLHEFVRGPRRVEGSWDSITDDLERELQSLTQLLAKSPRNFEQISSVLQGIRTLPVEVCLPLEIANHDDLNLITNLSHFRKISKALSELVTPGAEPSISILAIQCQRHLVAMASHVRLLMGALVSVALTRMLINSLVSLLDTQTLSRTEIDQLRTILPLPSFSFEEILIGEIGFVYFSLDQKISDESIETLRAAAQNASFLKSQYYRALLGKKMPFIDAMVRDSYLNNMCSCLQELRSKGDDFQLKDLRQVMSGSSPKSLITKKMVGPMNKEMFESAFQFEPNPGYLSEWIGATLAALSEPEYKDTNIQGDWGSIRVERATSTSMIQIHSFFGNPFQSSVTIRSGRYSSQNDDQTKGE